MAIDRYIATIGSRQAEVDDFVLDLFPRQGEWTEAAYLRLTDDAKRLVEFRDGYIEVLPMPTDKHQSILAYLFTLFLLYIQEQGGKVLFSPLRVRIGPRQFREPDLLLVRDANDPRRQNRYWEGADLVLEVVSPDKPECDLVVKRRDYADAGIPEYWIVNPQDESITVLRLENAAYIEHGVFERSDAVTSATLDGFAVDVAAVFDAD